MSAPGSEAAATGTGVAAIHEGPFGAGVVATNGEGVVVVTANGEGVLDMISGREIRVLSIVVSDSSRSSCTVRWSGPIVLRAKFGRLLETTVGIGTITEYGGCPVLVHPP